MSLDKIPEINLEVIEIHYHDRQSSEYKFKRFKQNVEEHLERNDNLKQLIEALALKSKDVNSVYETAYRLLDVINSQLEVNELNEMAEINMEDLR